VGVKRQPEARQSPTGTIWTRVRSWKGPGGLVTVVVRSNAGGFSHVSLREWDSWEPVA
jgi:hypothetical protein